MSEFVLIVDDEPEMCDLLSKKVDHMGHAPLSATSGDEAIRIAQVPPHPVVVLSDVRMPGMDGVGLLRRIKEIDANIQVVMVSGYDDLETIRRCLREGAYDYLIKPFEVDEVNQVIERAVEKYHLVRENEMHRNRLEQLVLEQTRELRQTRDIALVTLARLAESRDKDTGLHLERIAAYSKRLAQELRSGPYAGRIVPEFLEHLAKSSSLHDIGKVGIPDGILHKPGRLTPEETAVMKKHTTIGGETLRSVIEEYDDHTFLTMGMEIALCHHERWDGLGYPAGLAGTDIPFAARIVALVDVYDATTSKRPYKRAWDHAEAVAYIVGERGAHFDPVIVDAFIRCQHEIERIGRGLRAGKNDSRNSWSRDDLQLVAH